MFQLLWRSVAPLAGAWIETASVLDIIFASKVAPLAGAWIETDTYNASNSFVVSSLPLRERGLKLKYLFFTPFPTVVAPLAGAWIETFYDFPFKNTYQSRSPCGSVD